MATALTGTVFRIARFAVHDGPGIRTTVFLKGCPLRCWWCHSPESQSAHSELMLSADRCVRCGACLPLCPDGAISDSGEAYVTDPEKCGLCGACATACPSGARAAVGLTFTVDGLMSEIAKDVVFFDQSDGGVTISGGEPLMQPEFVEAVLGRCQAAGIHTALDTCGLADPDVVARIRPHVDLFLFDLKVVDDRRHRVLTGASNDRILANLRELVDRRANVRIRFPVVPGLNDDPENVEALGALVRSLGLEHIDLLPYHRAGIAKYDRLNAEYRLAGTPAASAADLDRVAATLARFGLNVHLGG